MIILEYIVGSLYDNSDQNIKHLYFVNINDFVFVNSLLENMHGGKRIRAVLISPCSPRNLYVLGPFRLFQFGRKASERHRTSKVL